MISNAIKEIESYKNKIATLEKKVEIERQKGLSDLHKKNGFETRAELIKALQSLEGGSAKKGRKAKKTSASAGAKKRSKRTKITADMKKKIVAAVKAGGKGTQIAKDFGISIPSLHNIKKAAGLVKARK